MNSPILFFVSLAAFAVGTYLHVTGMQRFYEYGQTERNPLWRDKYGFPAIGKYVMWLGIFSAGVVGLGLLWFGYQIWITFAIMAAGQFVFWMINSADAKRKRAVQTDMLTKLSEQAAMGNTNPADGTINAIFNPRIDGKAVNSTVSKSGRVWYRLFPWLYVDGSDQMAAVGPLREKVIAWSQQPAARWFDID
jgi:hypothetical protein